MADYAHAETDKRIEELEKRLQSEYRQAYKETKGKLEKYLSDFARKDEAKRKLVDEGKLSQADYKKWRTNQMLTGQRWVKMVDTLAKDMNRTNQIAADIISGYLSPTFALNANFAEYLIEEGFRTNYGFTLYNEDTVNRLIEENPDLLPAPRVDIPEDIRWNKQKITSNITQAVLQGKSIPEIAKTMQTVVGMNKASATRNARTAMTGAQNAGRQQAYDRAKAMGIKVKKEWIATLDGRTRHSHGMADGQKVELDGKFEVGRAKMRYPGDVQNGTPEEIYNCRCTMATVEPDYILKGGEKPKSFEEWQKEKQTQVQGWEALPDDIVERTKIIDKLLTEELKKKSVFNGKVIVDNSIKFNGTANYDGSITLRSNASTKTEIHELLHQHSEGGQNKVYVAIFKNIEEGSVELLAQEICYAKGIKIGSFDYAYTPYVDALRKINQLSKAYKTDYEFAKAVFDKSLEKRAEFLKSLGGSVAKDEKNFFRGALKTLGVK